MKNKFTCYYRVSTKKQGRSGLGLAAQKTMCESYINSVGGVIVNSFTDVQSGKKHNRIELSKAIEYCKENNSTLLVAKLDRLSREVEFIFNLRNSGIKFVCSDMPDFNTLTLGIFATIAQYERELISERTKKSLDELKKKGVKLGNPKNLYDDKNIAFNNSLKVRQQNALENENNRKAGTLIVSLRKAKTTWKDITQTLNDNGFKTRRGNDFTPTQVQRLYDRYK